MRAALILAVLLLAAPAHAASWRCALWPTTCQAPAPVQIPAPEPPAVAVVPFQAAPPVAPVVDPVPIPKAKPKRAKPKPAAVPSWCQYRPASEAQGKYISAQERDYSRACFNSKKR